MRHSRTILACMVAAAGGIWLLASAVSVHPRIEDSYDTFLLVFAAVVLTLSSALAILGLKARKWGYASFGALVAMLFLIIQILMIRIMSLPKSVVSPDFESRFLETCSAWERALTPKEKRQIADSIVECFQKERSIPGHWISIPFEKIKSVMGSTPFLESKGSVAYLISREESKYEILEFQADRRWSHMSRVNILSAIE